MKKFLRTLTLLALLVVPWVGWGQTSLEIGDGGTASNQYLPGYNYYNYSYTQQIYTATEIGVGGTITSIAFKNTGAEKTRTYDVYMAHTTIDTFADGSSWISMDSSDMVAASSSNTFTVGNWTVINLSVPFVYDGTSNLVVSVADVTGSYSSSPHMTCLVFDATRQAIRAYRDASAYDVTAPGVTGTVLNVKNQIVLGIIPTGGTICLKPSEFYASSVFAREAELVWTSTTAGNYVFEYKAASSDNWNVVSLTDTTYTLTGLQPETAYNTRVKAVCGTDFESTYKLVNFTTPISCPVPTALAATLTPGDGTVATLSWNPGAQESEWQLCINNDMTNLITLYDTSYSFTSLTPDSTYTAKVRAICDVDDTSAWSDAINYTPTDSYFLTVNEGTTTNGFVPIYGYWCDNITKSQFIIPAADLAAMQYGIVDSLVFYSSNANVSWGNAQFEVYMMETSETTISSLADYSSMTQVMNAGSLSIVDNQMVVRFNNPFQYMGGNLMIGFLQTVAGSYSTSNWYGVTANGASMGGYGTSISQRNFLPKTSFFFTPGTEPDCFPVTGLALVSMTATSADIIWNDNGSSYEVEVSQNGTPLSSVTIVVDDTTASISGLVMDNDYQISVRSVCGTSTSLWSAINVHIGYCLPSPTSVDNNGITSVSFGGMTNTTHNAVSGNAMYENFSSMAGSVPAGTTAAVEITYATGYDYGTIIWVDWDNSMTFDGDEVVYVGTSDNSNPTTLTATFDIPATQALGNYRMRILGADSYFDSFTGSIADAASASPCASYSWGVAEDYTLTVAEAPNCLAITDLAVSGTTANTVSLSWTDALNTGATYTVYDMADTSVVATGINGTTYTVTGLNASSSYTFGVVANCSATDASSMVTVSATTDCANGNCNIYVYAQDSYGDGWNGATIGIVQGVTNSYSMASQGLTSTVIYDTAVVSVCAGAPIIFNWTSGQYDGEISFEIANALGEVVMTVESGNSLTSGEIFFTMDSCNAAAPAPDSVTLTIAVNDATMGTTTPAPGVYQYAVGTTAYVTGTPNAGYMLAGWVASFSYMGTVYNDTLSYTDYDFTNPVELEMTNTMLQVDNLTVTALFAAEGSDTTTTDCTVTTLPYIETFDANNAMLSCWTTIDADGDGYNWALYNGGGSIASNSYVNGYGAVTPDNWLITPQITLPSGGNYEVSWSARPQDTNWAAEHYGLYVSTTTTDTTAFTLLQQWTLTSSDNPTIPVVNLNAYAGQNIYLALRHWNCTDMFMLIVDDFTVREQLNANQVLVTVNTSNAYYGNVSGGGVYTIGDNVTVTATPSTGYTFVNWTDANSNVVSTANPYTFVAATDVTLTANFSDGTTPQDPDSAMVTIAVNDATMGTVTPAPGTYMIPDDSVLTLTATAVSGYHFLQWNVTYYYNDNAQTQTFTDNPLNLSNLAAFSPLTFTAIFEEDLNCNSTTCDLVVNGIDSWGDGWNGGILSVMQNNVLVSNFTVDTTGATASIEVCSDYPVDFVWNSGSYDDEVSFTVSTVAGTQLFAITNVASLVNGNVFASVATPCTTPVVTFFHDTLTFTTAINDATMGSITPAPGTYQYLDTDTLFLSATPNYGYHFVEWNVIYNYNGTVDTTALAQADLAFLCSALLANQPLTFTAIFAADTLAIDCSGNTCYLTIEGQDGYGDGWNGAEIIMMQNDTVIGNFTLSSGSSNTTSFMVCSDYPVNMIWSSGNYDVEISFTVSNSYGQLFNITDASILNDTLFAVVNNVCSANATVDLDLDVDSLTIIVGVNDATMGTTNPVPGTYQISYIETMTLSAIPNTGYYFHGWAYSYNYEGTVYYDTVIDATLSTFDIEGDYWAEVTPVTFIALFSSEEYQGDSMLVNIAVNDPTMGTTNPAPGAHYFYEGETCSVIAMPYSGYMLEGWDVMVIESGDTSINEYVPYPVDDVFDLFDEPIVVQHGYGEIEIFVTAHFTSDTSVTPEGYLTLITAVNDATMGTMTPAPGTYQYSAGDVVNFSVTPYDGYHVESINIAISLEGMTLADTTFYEGWEAISAEPLEVDEEMLGFTMSVTVNFASNESINVAGTLDDLKVYPNPTYGIVNIDADDVVKVEVMDLNGRLVVAFDNSNRVDLSNLSAGTYMLRIQTTSGNAVKRVVKK